MNYCLYRNSKRLQQNYRSLNRSFSSNFYYRTMFVKRTILLCPSKHTLFIKRSVISPVILTPKDIITCQKMMNFIISKLSKGPLTVHDLIQYGYLASTLNLKYANNIVILAHFNDKLQCIMNYV